MEEDFCVKDGKLFYIGEEADKQERWQQQQQWINKSSGKLFIVPIKMTSYNTNDQ